MTDDLRRLAEAARDADARIGEMVEPSDALRYMEVWEEYRAAASPDVILGLLNSQRDWQEAAQEYERMLAIMVERHDRLLAALTALESDLAALPQHQWLAEKARAALAAGEVGE